MPGCECRGKRSRVRSGSCWFPGCTRDTLFDWLTFGIEDFYLGVEFGIQAAGVHLYDKSADLFLAWKR